MSHSGTPSRQDHREQIYENIACDQVCTPNYGVFGLAEVRNRPRQKFVQDENGSEPPVSVAPFVELAVGSRCLSAGTTLDASSDGRKKGRMAPLSICRSRN